MGVRVPPGAPDFNDLAASRMSAARTVLDNGGDMKHVDGERDRDGPRSEIRRVELTEIVRAGKGSLTEIDKGSYLI